MRGLQRVRLALYSGFASKRAPHHALSDVACSRRAVISDNRNAIFIHLVRCMLRIVARRLNIGVQGCDTDCFSVYRNLCTPILLFIPQCAHHALHLRRMVSYALRADSASHRARTFRFT